MASIASIEIPEEFIVNAKNRPPELNPCGHCQKPTRKRCGGCHVLYFCSQECLKSAWKEHEAECKQFQFVQRAHAEMASINNGKNAFETHLREKGHVLNTSFQKEEEFFAWTKDKNEVRRRLVYLQNLFNWVRSEYEPKGYTVELKLALHSLKEFVQLNEEAKRDPKKITILQFNFKHPWSILLANVRAAQGEKAWQRNAASIAGGWHLIVGDNYAEGGFSYSDEEMKERLPVYHKAIRNAVRTLGNFQCCAICSETIVGELRFPCTVCKNPVCLSCNNKIIEHHKTFYRCPFCRNEVQPDSLADDSHLKESAGKLLAYNGSTSRRQKVSGEVDAEIARLLWLLKRFQFGELKLYVEEEAIVLEGAFQIPGMVEIISKKIIIEVERVKERWDSITKILEGICKGEI